MEKRFRRLTRVLQLRKRYSQSFQRPVIVLKLHMEKTNTIQTPEIVVCEHNAHMPNLTKGKPYEIISRDENKIVIIDDSGRKNSYYASRFVSRKLELA